MVSTSNDGIMSAYLVKYCAIRTSPKDRAADLLETLYIADCYRAGQDLGVARRRYDQAIWQGVSTAELKRRLAELADFMTTLARDRLALWRVPLRP